MFFTSNKYLLNVFLLVSLAVLVKCTGSIGNLLTDRSQQLRNDEVPFQYIEENTIVGGNRDLVSRLCYQQKTNRLLAVYPNQGILITWDLGTKQPLSQYELGIKSPFGIGFSEACDSVIGATQYEFRYEKNFIEGVKIWDTLSGVEQECISYYCNGDSLHPGEIGATIDSTGQLVATFNEVYIDINSLNKSASAFWGVRGPDDISPTIGLVSFSPEPKTYAVAYLEGKVEIRTTDSLFPKLTLGQNRAEDLKPVYALAFDSTGQLIARIRGEDLTIWRKKLFSPEIIIDEKLFGQKYLQFDKTGKYVFVAGDDRLLIWGLDEKKSIAEYTTVGITSFVITNNNNLLFWGDKSGTIHVMKNSHVKK